MIRANSCLQCDELLTLIEDRARFPDRPDSVGRMIEAHIGNLKAGKESSDRYARDAMTKAAHLSAVLREIERLLEDKSLRSKGQRIANALECIRREIGGKRSAND